MVLHFWAPYPKWVPPYPSLSVWENEHTSTFFSAIVHFFKQNIFSTHQLHQNETFFKPPSKKMSFFLVLFQNFWKKEKFWPKWWSYKQKKQNSTLFFYCFWKRPFLIHMASKMVPYYPLIQKASSYPTDKGPYPILSLLWMYQVTVVITNAYAQNYKKRATSDTQPHAPTAPVVDYVECRTVHLTTSSLRPPRLVPAGEESEGRVRNALAEFVSQIVCLRSFLSNCEVRSLGANVTKMDVWYLFRKLLSSRPQIQKCSFWIDPVQKLRGLKVQKLCSL